MRDDDLRREHFGDDFTWGVATAAYQIEGAWNTDGKGPSIWDEYCHRRIRILNHDDGDVACDFYHRYPEDLGLTADMGFGAKRFSVSWPRVLPEGTGPVNDAGLDFYDRVVDECLARGLQPWVTLYHWDLPQALQLRGGWTNRDVVGWFEEYADVVARRLGDRVRHWMVFNEPTSFCVLGHLIGQHAPRRFGLRNFLASVHHVNLAQAAGARALRAGATDPVVGTSHYFAPIQRTGNSRADVVAGRSADAFVNRTWVEPNLGLGYPLDDCTLLRGVERFIRAGDDEAIRVDFDFLGVQYYTRLKAPPLPIPGLWTVPYFGKDYREYELTSMGWEVRPDGLYDVLARAHSYERFPSLVVTENGAAFPDHPHGDRVRDPRRIAFYEAHLAQVRRAVDDGIPVRGYFAWSLMDNFEWAEGYRPRFGLVYVDYTTQRRIMKDSGRWFAALLGGRAAEES